MSSVTLGQVASAITLLGVLIGAVITIVSIYIKYEKRLITIERKIKTLEDEIVKNDNENKLILKGLLACLKGLKEQGCNGPVTESIEEINDYLIKK